MFGRTLFKCSLPKAIGFSQEWTFQNEDPLPDTVSCQIGQNWHSSTCSSVFHIQMGKMCLVTDKREKHTSPFFESSQGFMRALEIYQNFMRDIKPSSSINKNLSKPLRIQGPEMGFCQIVWPWKPIYETRVTSKSETFKKTNVYSLLGGMRKCSKNQSCHIPWNFNNTNFLLSLTLYCPTNEKYYETCCSEKILVIPWQLCSSK